MKYLLDTNICINILRGRTPKLFRVINSLDCQKVCTSSIVKYELYYGVCRSGKIEKNMLALEAFLENIEIVPFDEKTAAIAGKVRAELEKKGVSIGPNDLLIAASAIANNCTLVTHNTKEFARVEGLLIEDWEK